MLIKCESLFNHSKRADCRFGPLSKYIFPEARMRFSPAQEQRRPLLQNYASIFSLRAQPIMEIDWRETGWFLEREEDDLAGYLFTEDCEVRKGLD